MNSNSLLLKDSLPQDSCLTYITYCTDLTKEEIALERFNHLAEVICLLELGFEGGFT